MRLSVRAISRSTLLSDFDGFGRRFQCDTKPLRCKPERIIVRVLYACLSKTWLRKTCAHKLFVPVRSSGKRLDCIVFIDRSFFKACGAAQGGVALFTWDPMRVFLLTAEPR